MKSNGKFRIKVFLSSLLSLVCISCQDQAVAQENSERSTQAADGSSKSRTVIATLAGKPIYADPDGRPEEAVWKQIMDAYVKEHNLSVSPAEVNAVMEHWLSQVRGGDQEEWRKYFREQFKDEGIREQMEQMRLEMSRWKFDSELYHKYKGRVCMSPAQRACVPIEARIRLLEEYEEKQLLQIVDPNLRERLHRLPESRSWDLLDEEAEFVFSQDRWLLTAEKAQKWQERMEQLRKAKGSSAVGPVSAKPTTPGASQQDQVAPPQLQPGADEDVEPAAPPNFAARTFNSDLKVDVWFQETPLSEPQRIGRTPSPSPLEIPACWQWWVIILKEDQWEPLLQEIAQKEVPGLMYYRCEDSNMKGLAGLTKLRCLRLPSDSVTDAGLAHLKGFTQLQVLELGSMWGITDAGLAHLKELTALRVLGVHSRALTKKGLAHLEGLTGLQVLDLENVTDAGLVHLSGLSNLRKLILRGTGITDEGLPHLGQLRRLKILLLDGAQISEVGLAYLQGLTRLEELNVGGYGITDAALAQIGIFTRLRKLDLSHSRISDAGLAHLKTLAKLERLALYHAPITGSGLHDLRDLQVLQELNLMGSEITDTGTVALGDLVRLKTLCLRETKITDAGLANLGTLTELRDLDLWRTDISDAGLAHLKALPGLQKLELVYTGITDAGLEHLKCLTGLQSLSLRHTKVSKVGAENLRKSLPRTSIDWFPE